MFHKSFLIKVLLGTVRARKGVTVGDIPGRSKEKRKNLSVHFHATPTTAPSKKEQHSLRAVMVTSESGRVWKMT